MGVLYGLFHILNWTVILAALIWGYRIGWRLSPKLYSRYQKYHTGSAKMFFARCTDALILGAFVGGAVAAIPVAVLLNIEGAVGYHGDDLKVEAQSGNVAAESASGSQVSQVVPHKKKRHHHVAVAGTTAEVPQDGPQPAIQDVSHPIDTIPSAP